MINLDAYSSKNTASPATYFEWSHTIGSGEDRMLVIAIATRVQWAISVTYNGVACNFATSEQPGSDVNAEIWYMPEVSLPEAGTYTIRVDLTGSQHGIGIASSWENVSQTIGGIYKNNGVGTTSSVSVTSGRTDGIIVDCIAKQSSGALTEDGSQTLIAKELGVVGAGGSSYKAWPGSSTTMEWNVVDTWAAVAIVLNELSVKVTLSYPGDDFVINSYTPEFLFTGVDDDGDDVEYEINIDITSNFKSMFSWYEETPGASANWGKCSASGYRVIAAERGYRLWYYDGSDWYEQQPAGDLDRLWSDVGISGTKMIASDNKSGGARLWYYNGSSWAEVRPCGDVNKNWTTCAIDDDHLVAAYSSGRIWHSTDGGTNWTELQPAGDVDKAWISVRVYGSTIIAAVNNGRLYYYDGASWNEQQPDGDSNRYWRCTAIYNGKMLAGQYSIFTTQHSKLFYYDGASWEELVLNDMEFSGEEFTKWTGVGIYDDMMIACGEYAGVYLYDGDKWMEVFPLGAPAGYRAWDGCAIGEEVVVAGYESGDLYLGWIGSNQIPMIYANSEEFEGFYRDGDTHPFTEGYEVSYTVQASQSLTTGVTYYWRVRGKDPDGSDEWSDWSPTYSFIISDFNPDDTTHEISSDNISLTQHQVLVVGDCTHELSSGNIALIYHVPGAIILVVEDCTHIIESDNLDLTLHPPSQVLKFIGVSVDDINKALGIDIDDISEIDNISVNVI